MALSVGSYCSQLAFIDGVEVFRDNLPAGNISFSDFAVANIIPDTLYGPFIPQVGRYANKKEYRYQRVDSGTGLLSGQVVDLAIQVHQRSSGSSDISLGYYMFV